MSDIVRNSKVIPHKAAVLNALIPHAEMIIGGTSLQRGGKMTKTPGRTMSGITWSRIGFIVRRARLAATERASPGRQTMKIAKIQVPGLPEACKKLTRQLCPCVFDVGRLTFQSCSLEGKRSLQNTSEVA